MAQAANSRRFGALSGVTSPAGGRVAQTIPKQAHVSRAPLDSGNRVVSQQQSLHVSLIHRIDCICHTSDPASPSRKCLTNLKGKTE